MLLMEICCIYCLQALGKLDVTVMGCDIVSLSVSNPISCVSKSVVYSSLLTMLYVEEEPTKKTIIRSKGFYNRLSPCNS